MGGARSRGGRPDDERDPDDAAQGNLLHGGEGDAGKAWHLERNFGEKPKVYRFTYEAIWEVAKQDHPQEIFQKGC